MKKTNRVEEKTEHHLRIFVSSCLVFSQINELQERLRVLQQQQQQEGMNATGSYSMQPMQPPPMGGMPNQAQMYGPGPTMQMSQVGVGSTHASVPGYHDAFLVNKLAKLNMYSF